jgi:MFS family permease
VVFHYAGAQRALSDSGFSKELAALGLGLIGLFTAPAMIFTGLLADRIGRQWSYVLGSVSLMIGILVFMMITDATSAWVLYAFQPFIALGFFVAAIALPDYCSRPVSRQILGAIIGAGAGIGP